jgi:hypothetical protein
MTIIDDLKCMARETKLSLCSLAFNMEAKSRIVPRHIKKAPPAGEVGQKKKKGLHKRDLLNNTAKGLV